MTPRRIQRRRTKGWKMSEGSVYVGRGSKFGNLSLCAFPHNCKHHVCGCCIQGNKRFCCVDSYREFVESGLQQRPSKGGSINVAMDAINGYPYRTRIVNSLHELRGKDLSCWCRLCEKHKNGRPWNEPCSDCSRCHADVLLELVNKEIAP